MLASPLKVSIEVGGGTCNLKRAFAVVVRLDRGISNGKIAIVLSQHICITPGDFICCSHAGWLTINPNDKQARARR